MEKSSGETLMVVTSWFLQNKKTRTVEIYQESVTPISKYWVSQQKNNLWDTKIKRQKNFPQNSLLLSAELHAGKIARSRSNTNALLNKCNSCC